MIRKLNCSFFVFMLFLVSASNYPAQKRPARKSPTNPMSAKQIAAIALPSVGVIYCDGENSASYASGFFIKPGIFVTNYHVIKGKQSGIVQIAVGRKKEKQSFRISTILGSDEGSDLAVLSIPSAQKVEIPVLSLSSSPIEVGQTIYVLGNPVGLVGTISPGIISAELRSSGKQTRLQITAPISPGSSGGPIVDEKGKIVGIVTSAIDEGQNLNFGVPSSLLEELLKNEPLYDVIALLDIDGPKPFDSNGHPRPWMDWATISKELTDSTSPTSAPAETESPSETESKVATSVVGNREHPYFGWTILSVSADSIFFLSPKRKTIGRYTQVWVSEVESIIADKVVKNSDNLWVVNCTTDELAIKEAVIYRPKYEQLSFHDDLKFSSAPPGSAAEGIVENVCQGK